MTHRARAPHHARARAADGATANRFTRGWFGSRGATLAEYALLICAIALVAVAGFRLLGGAVRTAAECTGQTVEGASSSGCDGAKKGPAQGAAALSQTAADATDEGDDEQDGPTSVGQPGTWESIIPIWGSGRSAIDDFQRGKWGWGIVNTALAVSDVFLVKSLVMGAGKLIWKGGVSLFARHEAESVVAKELAEEGVEVCKTACGRPGGQCFVAGTLVDTPSGLQPIETLRAGDRVLTSGDDGRADTAVDPIAWRDVRLSMPNPDGSDDVVQMEFLRPQSWLEEIGAAPGRWITLDLPEMRLSGPALVASVGPIPAVARGPGRVVTGTFTHLNGYLHVLRFANADDVLELTNTHRLFSADRSDWVAAEDIALGEHIFSQRGPLAVTTNAAKDGIEQVYNLEVETEHTYFVGPARVLSHNEYWTPSKKAGNLWNKGKLKEHFEKHGAEVGAATKEEYSTMAKEFGSAPNNGRFVDMTDGAFFYRYDPSTKRIFVGTQAGQKIKTFYKWDGRADDAVIQAMKAAGLL